MSLCTWEVDYHVASLLVMTCRIGCDNLKAPRSPICVIARQSVSDAVAIYIPVYSLNLPFTSSFEKSIFSFFKISPFLLAHGTFGGRLLAD